MLKHNCSDFVNSLKVKTLHCCMYAKNYTLICVTYPLHFRGLKSQPRLIYLARSPILVIIVIGNFKGCYIKFYQLGYGLHIV